MKPRIKRYKTIRDALTQRPAGYVCFSPGPDALSWLQDWSYGRSPQAAYDAWKRKQPK